MKNIKPTAWLSMQSILAVILSLCMTTALASNTQEDASADSIGQIHYHCATMAEGQQLIVANTDYYNSLNQMDLDWRMRKKGATKEKLIDFAKSCVQEFTDKEKVKIAGAIAYIEKRLHKMGANLPFPKDDIVFIKTNMQEEGGAGAYTHKTEIYIGANVVRCNERKDGMMRLGGVDAEALCELVAHELFHCLTRNSPEFRRDIYKLIGFTVMDKDISFDPAIQHKILTNPDVEHIDNYAEFTIKGKKRKCELMVLYTNSWEEASAKVGKDKATFFHFNQSVLVPIDKPNKYYSIEKASDFWDVIGHNTEYVLAPEETLADNFSYAVIDGPGRNSNIASAKEKEESQIKYTTPQLIDDIITFLKSYQQKD
ncbi:MAG: hypothetical protein K6F47_01005 [Bacteroidaceae bacterium]|nr:hypothetical protein [Bacteroidaceae bacterium]